MLLYRRQYINFVLHQTGPSHRYNYMNNDVKQPINNQPTAEVSDDRKTDGIADSAPSGVEKSHRSRYDKFAFLSIILTVVAWIILSLEGRVALAVCVAAFVLGCIGLKSRSRVWKNTAITSLVASAVLMVVLSAFMIVLFIGLNSI